MGGAISVAVLPRHPTSALPEGVPILYHLFSSTAPAKSCRRARSFVERRFEDTRLKTAEIGLKGDKYALYYFSYFEHPRKDCRERVQPSGASMVP
jgi:hypothetical protein